MICGKCNPHRAPATALQARSTPLANLQMRSAALTRGLLRRPVLKSAASKVAHQPHSSTPTIPAALVASRYLWQLREEDEEEEGVGRWSSSQTRREKEKGEDEEQVPREWVPTESPPACQWEDSPAAAASGGGAGGGGGGGASSADTVPPQPPPPLPPEELKTRCIFRKEQQRDLETLHHLRAPTRLIERKQHRSWFCCPETWLL